MLLELSPETRLGESPDKVQALTTILGNLVDNAFDALTAVAPPRRVVVEIVEDVDVITVVVTDNGPGIPPDLVPTIFLDDYTTKARPGIAQRGSRAGVGAPHGHPTARVGRRHGRARWDRGEILASASPPGSPIRPSSPERRRCAR